MLKVKYYASGEDLAGEAGLSGSSTVIYSEDMFRRLMTGEPSGENRPPFRDAQSRRILKESAGIEPAEDDWYSAIRDGKRTCFSELSPDLKYALVLIDQSRKGHFLSAESMQEQVWEAVSRVPFDILIACTWEDIFWTTRKLPHCDYVLLGFPYSGDDGIHVCRFEHEDAFYTPVSAARPEDGICGTEIADMLYIGRDGKYYSRDLSGSLRFYWRRNLDRILDYIDKLQCPRKLKTIGDTYSVFEFGRMIEPGGAGGLAGYVCDDYLNGWNTYKKEYKAGNMSAEEYRFFRNLLRDSDSYQEYLYYRDSFKIVNHMYLLPQKEMKWRKVPILTVTKNRDGSYAIGGGISLKFPWHEEIIGGAIRMCSNDHDTFMLYVDVDEILDRPEDLDRTVWAIWIRQDSIELFDKWDGLRLFAASVREALASGRCTINYDFY